MLAEVVVSGTRVQEVKTSEVGEVVSLQQIEVTPQITRNFLEFADTVPGMAFTVDKNGNTSIRGGAQIDSNVNVYIDGVGMKDYVAGGGISGQSGAQKAGDPGNPFPQLAIAEYKVITSNYKAEFDQVASAAISAESKSGTNEFTGEAFGNFTNQNLRAFTPAEASASQAADPSRPAHRPTSTASRRAVRLSPTSRTFSSPTSTSRCRAQDAVPHRPELSDPRDAPATAASECSHPVRTRHQSLHGKSDFAKFDLEPSENDSIEAPELSATRRNESRRRRPGRHIRRLHYKN